MSVDLVTRLEQHGREIPGKEAVVFVRTTATGPVKEPLTYGELDRRARSLASWLRERCAIGDRVMLLYGTGPEFISTLAACMYAGVVAVPAPQPSTQRGHSSRSDGIVRDAGIRLVLTDAATHEDACAFLADAGPAELACVATDLLELPNAPHWQVPPVNAGTPVIIQYTSGSTSSPKGVVVTHGSLAHNLGLNARAFGVDADSRTCSWLPQHHDMGLIGMLLTPLYQGGTAFKLASMDFLRRPHVWLDLIGRERIHTVVAPNFAYDLCTRRVTDAQLAGLDFSSLINAGNGAEPVSADTLRRFAERFAPAGFRPEHFSPCYGMAETTLIVSGTGPGQAPVLLPVDGDALAANEIRPVPARAGTPTLVSSGTVHDLSVLIVDPVTRQTLPDGRIGEIWVRGASVGAGYWRNEEATERTFRAVTAEGSEGYLRTGDTGSLYEGRLYVTGRIKEVLVVNGRNLYPHDIERELASMFDGFQGLSGSVCSVPAAGDGATAGVGEQLVVMHEVRRAGADADELAALARRMRAELATRVGVGIPHLLLLRPGQIRKTTSGKVQRTLMRELYLSGELEPLAADRSAAAARHSDTAGAA
ncbi:fatty acyl-AMP ligase [Streptomyces sp. NPDC040724]|uniref:fatty acyl-AMP ligase n=1 Tax=Streptomyces sp. NPDC040724 TaxID=3155612 RepID=UPI0033C69E60